MESSFNLLPINKLNKNSNTIAIVKGNDDNKKLFNQFLTINEDKTGKSSIKLPSDMIFQPVPSKKGRDVYYIVGASGSGKSYLALRIAQNYQKMYPDRPILLVSKLEQDETLDQLNGMYRINFNDWDIETPKIDVFADTLVIFDDFDAVEKPLLKGIQTVINDIAVTGRHTNTSMIYISHHISNYSSTRLILNEATHYVIYPHSTSYHGLYYLLSKYLGMSKEEIKKLKKLGSRWVCVHKNHPQYILSEHDAYMLNNDAWN